MNVNFHTFMTIDSDKFIEELQNRDVITNWDASDLHDVILQMDNMEYVNDADILGLAIQLGTTAKEYTLNGVGCFNYSDLGIYISRIARLINKVAVSKTFRIDSIVM